MDLVIWVLYFCLCVFPIIIFFIKNKKLMIDNGTSQKRWTKVLVFVVLMRMLEHNLRADHSSFRFFYFLTSFNIFYTMFPLASQAEVREQWIEKFGVFRANILVFVMISWVTLLVAFELIQPFLKK